jgi:hypothetical protein
MDASPGTRYRTVLDARALLARTVETVAESKTQRQRDHQHVHKALEHVVWSDYLMGESRGIADQLHRAIGSVVTVERDNGAPPEKVVTLLKGMITDARADKLGPEAQSLVDDVVRWGIESYYEV